MASQSTSSRIRALAVPAVGLLILVALLPTMWGAVASMGVSQWLAALGLGLVFAPAAIGIYITFRVLDFPDLTVDGSFPAGGAAAAVLITRGWPVLATIPAAMAIGAVLGAITGLLHIHLRINSLLASIITLTGAFTLNLRLQGSSNVSLIGLDRIFTPFTDPIKTQLESWFGETGTQIHRSVVTALVCFVITVVVILLLRWFFATEVGLAMRATGSNRQMSQSQAINTSRYLIGGVALSNALVGLTGALFVQSEGFADVNSGAGLIVAGLASVIIGEVLFSGKGRSMTRNLVAAALGMIVYRFAIALALNAKIQIPGTEPIRLEASDIKLATAAVVVLMLAVPRIRESRAESVRRSQA